MNSPSAAALSDTLAEHHRRFLDFLVRRVGSEVLAEDILQDAYAKSIEKADSIRDNESVVAWFYQLLRNAVVDHYRRAGTEKKARAELERASDAHYEPELRDNVCTCVSAILPSLKPEYAEIVADVELRDRSIAEVAQEKGLTANNATVRLHRARSALRRRLIEVCGACSTHGCVDCTCRAKPVVP
jgi:RNA polymerase sigma factor (sigma-70 family)